MEAGQTDAAPVEHGGDLGAARLAFPGAPEPFVDLSTGINPYPYPIPQLPPELLTRLPEQAALDRLAAIAAETYGAPSAAHVVPAPGSQILLPLVARLVRPGRAAVLGPTYAEHIRAAARAGHRVEEVAGPEGLRHAALAVVVNPNNPDGRSVPRQALLSCAQDLQAAGGLLVVDEAFMDVGAPGASLAADCGRPNVVVLRSFGKFFGLAGLRLGFALASPAVAARLRAELGPWAVAGPALAIGAAALADRPWAEATRLRLAQAARRLDQDLAAAGLQIIGGTNGR
jgi:cobalamin biosynthesis protein CobC